MSDIHTWQVPGRVNLIGEHLDYNGGPSLPFAIDRHLTLKLRRRDDDQLNIWSTLPDGARESARLTTDVAPDQIEGWAAYPAGVVWSLRQAGHRLGGADLVIESQLPTGAGLSSSAALTVATACALDDAFDLGLDRIDLALAAQQAENEFVGAPTGVMDQVAVLFGQRGQAVRTDAKGDRPTAQTVPFDIAADDVVALIVDTRSGHTHAGADSGYARRREECRQAAEALSLDHLAAAGPDAILKLDDETLKARTRHVITESTRVRAATRAMAEHNWAQLGTILTAGHESLRHDFEASCAQLDVAVETANEAGALGARLTGGGFGGSILALVARDRVAAVIEAIHARFAYLDWPAPRSLPVVPSDGARRIA